MSIKRICIISGIIVCSVAGSVGVYKLINMVKKNKLSDEDNTIVNDSENQDEYFNEVDVIADDETDIVDDDITPDDDYIQDVSVAHQMELHKFIAYLIKNGIDSEEAVSICETIMLIDKELPEKYNSVRKEMLSIMESDFDIERSHAFDNANYNLLYTQIDPCQLFAKNGFKILRMGSDCYEDMMNLADALTELIATDSESATTVMYEIYHIFEQLVLDQITPNTYEEKFKGFVDQYVITEPDVESESEIETTEVVEEE